jgi:hypothetical protein
MPTEQEIYRMAFGVIALALFLFTASGIVDMWRKKYLRKEKRKLRMAKFKQRVDSLF